MLHCVWLFFPTLPDVCIYRSWIYHSFDMASAYDVEFLKESGIISEETASKFGDSTRSEHSAFTASSPPVLEPSKDGSRSGDGGKKKNLLRKLLTYSLRESPSETVPIVSGGQQNLSDEQQINELVGESGTNCCTTAIHCCQNSLVKVRNSAFMYVLQLVFLSIPVSAIIMGLIFAETCPKTHFLPVFSAVIGVFGAIFMAVWMVVTYSNRHGTPCSNKQRLLFGFLCFMLLILTVVDAVFVFTLSPTFVPSSTDYCNETFYTYAFYKEIATAVVIVLSLIISIPGSRHTLCCQNCSMRSTPSAFYCSI